MDDAILAADEEPCPSVERCKTPPTSLVADALSSQRVFKKSAPNNKLTLYVSSRDLVICGSKIDRLQGVLLVEPDYLQDRKVFGQVVLTFRYGREDEEVMGLKFCNEAVMCLAQLYPAHERAPQESNTALQDALIKRLGANAHPFCMEVTPLAPPSVQLVPAKEYSGAPIGTSYDVRAYVGDRADEKLHRRSTVRMGIRVVQHASPAVPDPLIQPPPPPHAAVDKPFLLSDGRVELEASLDKAEYKHGEQILVNLAVHNNSNKTVRRIKVFVVQHVDVCMFSNGKFKNVVALVMGRDPLGPGSSLNRTYSLQPVKGATKNWIALEDSFSRSGACLASTVTCNSASPEDRNVFAIYVSYYVKVKLYVGLGAITAMGGELSLKLPFSLIHSSDVDPLTLPLSLHSPPLAARVEHSPEVAPIVHEKTNNQTDEDLDVVNHEITVDIAPQGNKSDLDVMANRVKVEDKVGATMTSKKKNVMEDENLILKCDSEPT